VLFECYALSALFLSSCLPSFLVADVLALFQTWLDAFGGNTVALMTLLHDVLPREVRGFLQDVKAAKVTLVSFAQKHHGCLIAHSSPPQTRLN
jgi:hypothetical protein